jgi:hypothetical protein
MIYMLDVYEKQGVVPGRSLANNNDRRLTKVVAGWQESRKTDFEICTRKRNPNRE